MPTIDRIRDSLAGHEARLVDQHMRRAAVAMVLRETLAGPEVLFIERAVHEGDPWSGHMAFPGGRVDPGDAHARGAAERETREEVGLDLAGAELLGRLDDLHGRRSAGVPQLVISGFVYRVEAPPVLAPNHEVQQAFWFPLLDLHAPERLVPHTMELPLEERTSVDFPGILVGEPGRHVVWGLTYRFLEVFFQIVEKPLPERWGELDGVARDLR